MYVVFYFKCRVEILSISWLGRFEAWIWSLDGKMKMMNCKLGASVYGVVRPVVGSLLVAGALFCLGLMSECMCARE